MHLGVEELPHGVGWGVGLSSSGVSSCSAVSAILPIPRFPLNFLQDTHFGHPSQTPYTPIGGFPPIEGDGQHASGGEGTAPWGGVGCGAEFEWGGAYTRAP